MTNKVFAACAAALLLAACGSTDSQNVTVGSAATPGTAADFQANIRDRVFFAFNKSNLTDDAKKVLEAQAAWLKTYGSTKATLAGHTDVRGTRQYNLALGARRAESVKAALTGMGVATDRLKTMSFGKDKPEAMGTTDRDHALNRRVVTVIE
jgi:peptidoglycan-associated lipoprotein